MSSRDEVGTLRSSAPARWSADEALVTLYGAHWHQLVRLAVMLVRDQGTAEEVVQDAFVAMHGRWSRLRETDKALAYLRRSVTNGARSVLRHRTVVDRHAEQLRHRPADVVPGADHAAVSSARREAVLDALAALPQRQREVVTLRYYLDLSEAEIASTLRISRGAVKSHASRAATALRTRLGDTWTEGSA